MREAIARAHRVTVLHAAIDNSQTDPAWVAKTAELLRDSVQYYMYVSSTGVFFPYDTPHFIKEDVTPIVVDPDGTTASYGVRKRLSEIENAKVFGDRAINVRPNFIVGPGDESDRLINIAGDDTITMKKFHDGLGAVISSPPHTLTWISDLQFLRGFKLGANVPWIPPKLTPQRVKYGQNYINSDKAVAAGLRYRPMTDTIRDAAAWWQSLSAKRRANNKFSYKPEAEAAALAAWHAKMGEIVVPPWPAHLRNLTAGQSWIAPSPFAHGG